MGEENQIKEYMRFIAVGCLYGFHDICTKENPQLFHRGISGERDSTP